MSSSDITIHLRDFEENLKVEARIFKHFEVIEIRQSGSFEVTFIMHRYEGDAQGQHIATFLNAIKNLVPEYRVDMEEE